MKKLLIAGITALSLSIGLSACAETASGKVVKVQGDTVTIRGADGAEHTMKTNESTTYRKKMATPKAHSKHMNHPMTQKPILVEDDYIEVIYYPATDTEWVIEDAVIYTE